MVIEKLVVKTGTQCSLRCKKCGEFNPYLSQKGKGFSLSANELADDVFKIYQCIDRVKCVHVAGGEPLLHRDLFLFLSFLFGLNNIERVEIVTNGTIIPDAVTMHTLSVNKGKAIVLISDYSASGVDNRSVVNALEEAGVSYHLMSDMVWKDKSEASYKRLSEEELLLIANNCDTFRQASYFSLINGVVTAHCPTAGSLLYYHDLYEQCPDHYFDLRSVPDGEVRSELSKLLTNSALPMCQYCVPSYLAEKCPAGEQIDF